MSIEHSMHISKSEALFATTAGVLVGVGILLPGLAGLGLTVGAIGLMRLNGRERERQFKYFSKYLSDSYQSQNDKHSNTNR